MLVRWRQVLALTGSLVKAKRKLLFKSELMDLLKSVLELSDPHSAFTALESYLNQINEQNLQVDSSLTHQYRLCHRRLEPDLIGVPAWNYLRNQALQDNTIIYSEKTFAEFKISSRNLLDLNYVLDFDAQISYYSMFDLKKLNLDGMLFNSEKTIPFYYEFLTILQGCSPKCSFLLALNVF
jgi:hypothetical protein